MWKKAENLLFFKRNNESKTKHGQNQVHLADTFIQCKLQMKEHFVQMLPRNDRNKHILCYKINVSRFILRKLFCDLQVVFPPSRVKWSTVNPHLWTQLIQFGHPDTDFTPMWFHPIPCNRKSPKWVCYVYITLKMQEHNQPSVFCGMGTCIKSDGHEIIALLFVSLLCPWCPLIVTGQP